MKAFFVCLFFYGISRSGFILNSKYPWFLTEKKEIIFLEVYYLASHTSLFVWNYIFDTFRCFEQLRTKSVKLCLPTNSLQLLVFIGWQKHTFLFLTYIGPFLLALRKGIPSCAVIKISGVIFHLSAPETFVVCSLSVT